MAAPSTSKAVLNPRRQLSILEPIRGYLAKLSDPSAPLLPFIPKPLKIVLLLLLIINSPSFPLSWHARVWVYPLQAYWTLFTKGRLAYLKLFRRNIEAKGGLRGLRVTQKRIAWIDDCDYNAHMSNSSASPEPYNGDALRMKYCLEAFAPLFTPKAYMALAGSHYVFFKEIPFGVEYTMSGGAIGWGEKWMYFITEFIIYPKKTAKGKGKGRKSGVTQPKDVPAKSENKPDAALPSLSLPTISADPSRAATPDLPSGTSTPPVTTMEGAKRIAYKPRSERSDGGIVCCTAIHEYCYKIGRVTIPPRIALFFSQLSPKPEDRERAQNILIKSGDFGAKWLKGGWKDEPDADTLGLDIGAGWIETATEGIEKVVEGISMAQW